MKWIFCEPKSGDMIRVKAGNVYHYGIFINDEEVIQFGLSPVISANSLANSIVVVATNIDVFLQNEFVEVASYSKKEERKKKNAEEIIKIARSRVGEAGYNILYNNCEHFAYECVFGEKKSEQVEKYGKSMPFVDVYFAQIPRKVNVSKVYPPQRDNEINGCTNESVKVQKYCVWKLLEVAIKKSFKLKFDSLNFEKKENGQWTCGELYFSLSHSKNLVAVSLSNYPTGIDVESVSERELNEKLVEKVLTPSEYAEYEKVEPCLKKDYFVKKWTQKESEFKRLSQTVFSPNKLNVTNFSQTVRIGGQRYFLSVASKDNLLPRKIKKIKNSYNVIHNSKGNITLK